MDRLGAMFPQIEALMEFASSAVRSVAGNVDEHKTGQVDPEFEIMLCRFEDGTGQWMDMVFVPKNVGTKLILAVPAAIADSDDFPIDTKRVWLLESKSEDGRSADDVWSADDDGDVVAGKRLPIFKLRGKTAVVGPNVACGRKPAMTRKRVIVSG
jgi:hypothetical protein